MAWQRVVGWVECVARAHPAAIQRHRSRDFGKMERFLTAGRNPCLPAGIWISVLYLEQQDAQNLAARGMRNAPPHRRRDGNVSFFAGYDCPQRGRVRSWLFSPKGTTDYTTA